MTGWWGRMGGGVRFTLPWERSGRNMGIAKRRFGCCAGRKDRARSGAGRFQFRVVSASSCGLCHTLSDTIAGRSYDSTSETTAESTAFGAKHGCAKESGEEAANEADGARSGCVSAVGSVGEFATGGGG